MMDEVALARLARQYSREAIAALVLAIRDADDLRIKVSAALGLLDRAYGRPAPAKPPAIEHKFTVEDLDAMIAEMERQLDAAPVGPDPATGQTSSGEPARTAGAASPAISIVEAAPSLPDGPRRDTPFGPSPDLTRR
jgi:cytosine/adenosine deaminase-related metal-dependent hydrolase